MQERQQAENEALQEINEQAQPEVSRSSLALSNQSFTVQAEELKENECGPNQIQESSIEHRASEMEEQEDYEEIKEEHQQMRSTQDLLALRTQKV